MHAEEGLRFFAVECLGVPRDVCETIARLLRRVEAVGERICPEYLRLLERLGERLTIYVVYAGIPPGQLERVDAWLAATVRRMREGGVVGVASDASAVVLMEPGEYAQTVEAAVEEALHLLMENAYADVRLMRLFDIRDELDAWLAEELLVHEIMHRLGIITEEELEEMQRFYMEVYEREAGRPAPREYLEKARRLAEEVTRGLTQPA